MYNISTSSWDFSDRMLKLRKEKDAANTHQKRRHEEWTENYDLYRGKVKVNRLTQRQAVNIPLMKETIKTLLSKIDEVPTTDWQERGGDEYKELLYQEIWDTNFKEQKLELMDILDKKNVLIYGIGSRMLNIAKNGITIAALDPFDVVYDPLMNPGDVESARFIVRQNIFKTVEEILNSDRYTEQGKSELKIWADSPAGMTMSQEHKKQWEEKMKRMKDMGTQQGDLPKFAGGDRLIALSEHYFQEWNEKSKKWERKVAVYAEDTVELSCDYLVDLIGVEFWPFVVWNEDPESQDIYADAVADLVRTPNKVINVWFSQLIENRTLKNFQMHWYMPSENYTAQTYTPGPGVMLPAPPGDDIRKVIMPVEISGLDDTLQAIGAVTQIVERGTGATALEKGQSEGGTQTLGEVELIVGKAMERTVGMSKFYRLAWYETADKWNQMMHANAPKVMNLTKKGRSGKSYTKKVYATDWKSEEGYIPKVGSSSEQEQESVKTLQKFQYVMQQFPNNPALRLIAQKRELESLNLTADELKQIEAAEKQIQEAQMQQMMMQQAAPQEAAPQGQPAPQGAPDPNMQMQLQELQAMQA